VQPFVPGDAASALINVARNLGGSIGVALAQTVLAQRQQLHRSRLIEHIAPCDIGYQQTVRCHEPFFPGARIQCIRRRVAGRGQTLQHQVDLFAYIDVFRSLAIIGAIMIPIALTLKSVDLGAPTRGI
jgi:DHA2 family multidrug resistance protein